MAEQPKVTHAELRELSAAGDEVPDSKVPVQFNPESLKVSFANQVVPPATEGKAKDQRGTTAIQYVGKGTTKLSVQLWFDVNAPLPEGQTAVQDVRELTKKVAYFITPKPAPDDPTKDVPPGVRFIWGTFQFDGIMESMEESLEFFSPEGRPLRASVTLNVSQQKIQFAFATIDDAGAGARGAANRPTTPGTRPLTQAPAGSSLQGLAGAAGKGDAWMDIGIANGIENPRLLEPGQLIDLNATASLDASVSFGASSGASVNVSVGGGGGGGGLGASLEVQI
jgi:hypothetical protein